MTPQPDHCDSIERARAGLKTLERMAPQEAGSAYARAMRETFRALIEHAEQGRNGTREAVRLIALEEFEVIRRGQPVGDPHERVARILTAFGPLALDEGQQS